jgi:hypothetical protein
VRELRRESGPVAAVVPADTSDELVWGIALALGLGAGEWVG